jgi:hypothetical protein
MAKRKKTSGGDCTRKKISFRTKRGKVVSFMGRPGGMTSAGGSCKPIKRKVAHLAKYRFTKGMAKKCGGKSHKRHGAGASPFAKCMGSKVG